MPVIHDAPIAKNIPIKEAQRAKTNNYAAEMRYPDQVEKPKKEPSARQLEENRLAATFHRRPRVVD